MIAIDFETHLIQPGCLAPKIVCLSWADVENRGGRLEVDGAVDKLESVLDGTEVICGANIAYDFGCALASRPSLFSKVWAAYEAGRVFDVQIAATLLAISEGRLQDGVLISRGKALRNKRYSLDVCVQEFLNRDDAKRNDEYRLRYAELDGVPVEQWPDVAVQYPKDDASNTLAVAEVLLGLMYNRDEVAKQCWAAFCLHLGAIEGLRADAVAVENLEASLIEERIRLRSEGASFIRADGSKDIKALRQSVADENKAHTATTAKGAVSTARAVLLASSQSPIKALGRLSAVDKLLTTYVPVLQQAAKTGINVRCNPLLATGRASYEGVIQQMPRTGGVRECFVPRGTFSSVDYAAIEMAALAQVHLWMLGRSSLAEAINDGRDLHALLGSQLSGDSYDEFQRRLAAPETRKRYKDFRQAAKAANFGFPGMMGAPKFVGAKLTEGASVCEWLHADGLCAKQPRASSFAGRALKQPLCLRCIRCADDLRERFLRQWPEMRIYWRHVEGLLDVRDGRVMQYISGRIRGGLTAPQAANTLFQGLCADGAKHAVIRLTEECYAKSGVLAGSRLVVFAHDETILDVPGEIGAVRVAAARQVEIMVESMKRYIPDVRVTAEAALMRRWSKSAEAVFDANNQLCVWEPK